MIQLIICEPRVMLEAFSLLNGLAFKEFLFHHAGSWASLGYTVRPVLKTNKRSLFLL